MTLLFERNECRFSAPNESWPLNDNVDNDVLKSLCECRRGSEPSRSSDDCAAELSFLFGGTVSCLS